jgi:sulfite exporter TauE/SafE
MTLGSIAGLLGAEFFSIGGLQSVFSYVLGVMILLAGLGYMGLLPKISNGRFAAIVNWAKGWLTTLQGHNSIESRLMLGLLTPLLPCGILYAIVIESASAGSVIGAALHMGAFALGTIPALLGFGALAASAQGPLRKHGPRLAGILLVVMGILTIARGAGFAVSIPFQSSKAVQCTSCKTQ